MNIKHTQPRLMRRLEWEGMTVADLAEKMRVDKMRLYSKLERNRLKWKDVCAVCDALGAVNPFDIFDRQTEQ